MVDKEKFRPVDTPILAGDNGLIKKLFDLSPQYKMIKTLEDLLEDWRLKL